MIKLKIKKKHSEVFQQFFSFCYGRFTNDSQSDFQKYSNLFNFGYHGEYFPRNSYLLFNSLEWNLENYWNHSRWRKSRFDSCILLTHAPAVRAPIDLNTIHTHIHVKHPHHVHLRNCSSYIGDGDYVVYAWWTSGYVFAARSNSVRLFQQIIEIYYY